MKKKTIVITHEIGHALKLSHINDNPDLDDELLSIMNQGALEYNDLVVLYPSFLDKVNLIRKWGV